MEKKITTFMLIPPLNPAITPSMMFEQIINMFGTLNIEEAPDDIWVLKINIPVSYENEDRVIATCNKYGYSGLFIIENEDDKRILENSIRL